MLGLFCFTEGDAAGTTPRVFVRPASVWRDPSFMFLDCLVVNFTCPPVWQAIWWKTDKAGRAGVPP